jgi:hypothetical protein
MRELPPGYEIVTDRTVFKWRRIETQSKSLQEYITAQEAAEAAWNFYHYDKREKERIWEKVEI